MTCIIGYIDSDDGVWMGGDSFLGTTAYNLLSAGGKITRRKLEDAPSDILFGWSGSVRGGSLLRYMKLPPFTSSLSRWAQLDLVNALRKQFKDGGFLERSDEKETTDVAALMGVGGRLFSIWQDFSVCEMQEKYQAIGAGMYIALGAMCALANKNDAPRQRVLKALKASGKHSPLVSPPYGIHHAPLKDG